MDFFYLRHRRPVKTRDIVKAFRSKRRIRLTCSTDYVVSTVFLVMDHGVFCEPQLFETMIKYNGEFTEYQTRCATHRQALKMHWAAVHYARKYEKN